MKTLVILVLFCALWLNVTAQAPLKMSYQAVMRNASGELITNHVVGMRITILAGALPGTTVYQETQTPTTNDNGLVTIEIGGGTGFDAINWGNGIHFIRTETDPAGGTNYTIIGTSQLLSVPYALYAKTAANGVTSEMMTNWNTAYGWGNHAGFYKPVSYLPSWVEITGIPSGFADGVDHVDDADNSMTNEIQVLSLTGNNLSLSRNGGMLTLPGDGWGTQSAETDATLTGNGTPALPLKIADNAITTAKIANSTIVAADLANSAVTTDKINSAAVTGAKIAQAGATTSQVLKWTGSVWAPGNDSLGSSLWTKNRADISYNNGGVGIGTTTPAGFLNIQGNSNPEYPQLMLSESEADYARFSFKNTAAPTKTWTIAGRLDEADAVSRFNIWYWNGLTGANIVSITGSGNMGIGTSYPVNTLHVNGTAQINGALYMENHKISNVSDPVNPQDAATKAYVDAIKETIYDELLDAGLNGIVKDVENNTYKTIKIGSQVWMAENLRTTKYNDGSPIPLVTGNTEWDNLTTGGFCYYNNDPSFKNIYGAVYNWYAVSTEKLCPAGWHVPSDAEWTTLTNYLINNGYGYEGSGDDIAKSMASTTLWDYSSAPGTPGNDPGSNNSSGFSALPGGYRNYLGNFYYIGNIGYWWSSAQYSTANAWYRAMSRGNTYVTRSDLTKEYGFSIRCLRDF